MADPTALGRSQTVEPHRHVTLDEEVFYAYQDIALAARGVGAPGPSLSAALERLGAALEATYEDDKIDPRHHLTTDASPQTGGERG